ncbi:VCBS repeat-containing protein [Aestuariibaculum marinum]|uniref:VCBS repeat-containing protein n=1 Tax=Aestuariibaculum marinum TaxID=2683592 RepID=A0A8J6Q5Y4_9FLAO|nr:VCBS repeat-containing protein [Aestuariibaculum marinum]MBD0825437.1 VCBS repeat-containing protein [Aestuariibaculum marinum]
MLPSWDKTDDIFVQVNSDSSNVKFANVLTETKTFNYYTFPYMYFGGGVATGDINNDGLPDLYFTGNMVKNALYLNQGSLQFEDISESSGTIGTKGKWANGVTMADVNNDGLLDIYVCYSGPGQSRENELFINKGNNTFRESAKNYNIADNGHSVQAAFFDYDNDGDLDLYVANYPPTPFQIGNNYYADKKNNPSLEDSDKLFRNDGNNKFTDVTEISGILNFGLSLGLSISDINNDGWPDIYVSNDFNAPDYLYINQKDGSFKNEIDAMMTHTSNFGMGTDAADFNNDGLIDLIQVDMASSQNDQEKANMSAMNTEKFYEAVRLGLHHQYMKNSLQVNTGSGTFSDVAYLAGLAKTEWSWGPLFFDFDNDGWKDIFITNGIRRNVNDNDAIIYLKLKQAYNKLTQNDIAETLSKLPVIPVDNYLYHNSKSLKFDRSEGNWGLSFKGFSNGASYADLDNDGDLDMIVNNLDATSSIFENKSNQYSNTNYLTVSLKAKKDNYFGVGAKIIVVTGEDKQIQELFLTRGFESSTEPRVHFGLGDVQKVDTLKVVWPSGHLQTLTNVDGNQILNIVQNDNNASKNNTYSKQDVLFTEVTEKLNINYKHQENEYNDFDKETLLPHKMSTLGPFITVGDVNGDGYDDFYVGGAMGQSGKLFIQSADGTFVDTFQQSFTKDKVYEDMGALFFDADADGDLDLYVVSGGNELPKGNEHYQDRLYLNDGKGVFNKNINALPKIIASGSCVTASDFDNDGDLDLFVGGRLSPQNYPNTGESFILENRNGTFKDITNKVAPGLKNIGMVTSAEWNDLNNDGTIDLLISGEWMPITALLNNNGTFEINNSSKEIGWWNHVTVADLKGDGSKQIIGGNLGLNYKYQASHEFPFVIYGDDFDENGSSDIVLGYYNQETLYPVRGRSCSSDQIPSIKKKFPNYTAFSKATLQDVYGKKALDSAKVRYAATNFASGTFSFDNNMDLAFKSFPVEAQVSSVNDMLVQDFDGDGFQDIIIAGNLMNSEVETPRNDAGFGLFLKGKIDGSFHPMPSYRSGILFSGQITDLALLETSNGKVVLAAANNGKLNAYRIN